MPSSRRPWPGVTTPSWRASATPRRAAVLWRGHSLGGCRILKRGRIAWRYRVGVILTVGAEARHGVGRELAFCHRVHVRNTLQGAALFEPFQRALELVQGHFARQGQLDWSDLVVQRGSFMLVYFARAATASGRPLFFLKASS